MKKMVIFGGSGFLGREIIQQALHQNFDVTSISRSGAPEVRESWMNKVRWLKADVFDPNMWRDKLVDVDVVIDAIGVLIGDEKLYEKMNILPAKILAKEASTMHVPTFVYISAKPFSEKFLTAYFISKKEAERAVKFYYLDALIVRPSFMYGKRRKGTTTQAKFIQLAKKIPFVSSKITHLQPQAVEHVAHAIIAKLV